MKRLIKRLIAEVNQEAKQLAPYYLKSREKSKASISRLVGPNYLYFTNGILIKVFFEGTDYKKYPEGLMFPISNLELRYLKNILSDLKALKVLNEAL